MQIDANGLTLSPIELGTVMAAAGGLGLDLVLDGDWREQESVSTGAAAHALSGEWVLSVHLADLNRFALFVIAVHEALGKVAAEEVFRDVRDIGQRGDYCLRNARVKGAQDRSGLRV